MKSLPLSPIVEANVIGIAINAASNRLRQQANQLLQANTDLENQVNDRIRELTDKTLLPGTTLAHMDQGLMVIDENKRVQLYNARAAELTGTPESILAGFSSVSDNIEYLKKHGVFEQTPEDMQLLFDDALKRSDNRERA
jgi:PAS domain-containing protein